MYMLLYLTFYKESKHSLPLYLLPKMITTFGGIAILYNCIKWIVTLSAIGYTMYHKSLIEKDYHK